MFEDQRLPIQIKLSALWTATTLCYLYGDYFGLYIVGRVSEMNAGNIPPLGEATPQLLLMISIMMAIPAVMVFFTVILPPRVNRWCNIIMGFGFTGIVALTIAGAAPFYIFLSLVEIVMTLTIVYVAWTWPKSSNP